MFKFIETNETIQEEIESLFQPEFICTTKDHIYWCKVMQNLLLELKKLITIIINIIIFTVLTFYKYSYKS